MSKILPTSKPVRKSKLLGSFTEVVLDGPCIEKSASFLRNTFLTDLFCVKLKKSDYNGQNIPPLISLVLLYEVQL